MTPVLCSPDLSILSAQDTNTIMDIIIMLHIIYLELCDSLNV